MRRRFISAAAAAAVALLVGGASPNAHAGGVTADPCDWDSFGNGVGHANAVAADCSSITSRTVADLKPAALYRTRDSITGTPTVVGGMLYVGGWDGVFYAFPTGARGFGDDSAITDDVETVEPAWTFTVDDTNGVSFGRIVSSAAVTDPVPVATASGVVTTRLVMITGGSTLYVLDSLDRNGDGRGDRIASICLDPRTTSRCQGSTTSDVEVEASPVVVRLDETTFRILVGNDVHNASGVGRTGVTAVDLDLNDGTLTAVWKFDPEGTSIDDTDGATYSSGDVITSGAGTDAGCGSVWGTPAVNVEADLVVLGTGSCPVDDPDASGSGEKVYAVDLQDGAFRWRFAPSRPYGSRTDDDFGSSPQLFEVDGTLVAGAGSKDGTYYALDASTGVLRWAAHVGQPGHTYEDFAVGGIIGTPAVGESRGAPAVFITTAVSTPIGAPIDYGTIDSIDASLADDPGRMLSLHAVDARTGQVLWRQPWHRQSYGHPTYVNGVVLAASTVGLSVNAYAAATGRLLWSSPLNGAPSSGVAVVGDSIYLGAGTRQSDAGFKIFGSDSCSRRRSPASCHRPPRISSAPIRRSVSPACGPSRSTKPVRAGPLTFGQR